LQTGRAEISGLKKWVNIE